MESNLKHVEFDGELKAFPSEKSFLDVSEELRSGLSADRVLAEIYVDNKPVDLIEEERINSLLLKDLGDVVIKSRRVDELFFESLQSAPHICSVLKQDCLDVEEFLKTEKMEDAHERVIEMTALLEWLIQLVIGTQSIKGSDVERLGINKADLADAITRMQYQLVQLHFYMGSQNWEEFKKSLAGPFREELTSWENIFKTLATGWTTQTSGRES